MTGPSEGHNSADVYASSDGVTFVQIATVGPGGNRFFVDLAGLISAARFIKIVDTGATPGGGGLDGFNVDALEALNSRPVNRRPTANAGVDQTIAEGTVVSLDGTGSSDADGPIASYAWTQVAGPAVSLSGSGGVSPTFVAPVTGPGGSSLIFELVVGDGELTSLPSQVRITVTNVNDPPRCDLATARPSLLWPPNHTLIPIVITGVTDPNNDRIAITVIGVTQDEPVNGVGDGDTSPDAVVTGGGVRVRAERAGVGNGRVYRIQFTASDGLATGGSCTGTVVVGVPRNPNAVVVDDGQHYDSTQP